MAQSANKIEVYLEIGKKRTFAGALDWPGWCRSGRDEAAALQALSDYGSRYAAAIRPAGLGFQAPAGPSAFVVTERLEGNATTDFGAPDAAPTGDLRPAAPDEIQRFQALMQACWQAFEAAARAAAGKELRKGPRGGGRDLEGIAQHVLEAERAYLARLGGKVKQSAEAAPGEEPDRTRQAILQALEAAARGELPAQGPRGGLRWKPRYFVRRAAWHVLDHVWEIEDRLIDA